MKKLIALMLMLVLCAAAAAEAPDYTGTWALTSLTIGSTDVHADTLGANLSIKLNEDGSCTLTADGRSETGSWSADETGVTITDAAGAANTLVPAGDALTLTRDDAVLTFEPAAEPVTVLGGLTVGDFNGVWTLYQLEMAQGIIPQANLGVSMTITLQDGQGVIVMVADAEEVYPCECAVQEYAGLGSVLLCYFVDPDTGVRTGGGLPLLLFSDGQLVWLDSGSTGDYYYCFRNAAAQ